MHNSKRSDKISIQIEKLGITTLVVSLAIAMVATIWAIYFESLMHNPSNVGLINTIFGILGIVGFVLSIPLIEKNSKTKIFGITLLIYSASYFLFSIFDSIAFAIILGSIIYLSASLRINTLGLILRNKSKNQVVSKNIGFMYTLLNISWLVGPVAAGFLAEKLGIKFVFLISGILMLFAFILLKFLKVKDNKKSKKIDGNFFKIIKEFFSSKKLVFTYLISGGISFWWAFIYIFIPILIIESGKNDIVVGYFLAGVILPLVLLEYFFGKLAGKSGFKKMFFRGYLILAIVAVISFFINDLYAILVLLVLGSVGMAMLEPTTEAYFFDMTNKKQRDKFYGVYNTTIDINYAVSLFLISLLIKFIDFKYSFLLIGFFMMIFALLSLRTKNVIEERKRN